MLVTPTDSVAVLEKLAVGAGGLDNADTFVTEGHVGCDVTLVDAQRLASVYDRTVP